MNALAFNGSCVSTIACLRIRIRKPKYWYLSETWRRERAVSVTLRSRYLLLTRRA
jgi:hypothetical protein